MQLHRPKALDDLNVDFFSGDVKNDEKEQEKAANNKSDNVNFDFTEYVDSVSNNTENSAIQVERKIPHLPNKDYDEPYSKEEILDFLAEDFSKLDEVIDNPPFTGVSDPDQIREVKAEEPIHMSESVQRQEPVGRKPLVDEKTALESFPDLSESIIDRSGKPIQQKSEKQREKDAIKQAKDNAKNSIENEKKRIKEQKKLEQTVQRPFGKRRLSIFMLVMFLVLGILLSSASAVVYAIEKSGEGYIKISDITIAYVDGDTISGDTHIGEYVFVKQGRIQGNDTLLFFGAGNVLSVADVIGFGDGLYAVEMGSTVYRVDRSNILGCAKFKTPNLAIVRNTIAGYSFMVFGILAIYFVLVILFSSMRLRKLNAVIRGYKESYELV